jgi:hypothetical protein
MRRMVRFLVAASLATTPMPCFAQAWIGPKGEVSASLTYQFADYLGHLDEKGNKVHLSPSRAQGITIEAAYNVSDRLAVGVSLPYTATQNGKDPSPTSGHVGIDDGRYHASWQDYHFDVRYNVLMRPLVLTPFFTYVQPSHHYPTIGEAGSGRDLREAHIGFDIGRLLDPLAPNAYFDAHAGYVFSEKLLGIGTNRTVADLAAGYFVTPRFSPRLIGSYVRTHGGLTSDYVFGLDIPRALFLEHDRLLRDTHLRVGLGVSFAITSTLDLNAGYVRVVNGTNTHYGRGVSIGIARTFAGTR